MALRILLASHHLVNLSGSELNVLDLARTFRARGDAVRVATLMYGDPMRELFEQEGIEVVRADAPFAETRYDLLWAQHTPALCAVLAQGVEATKVLFSSLSPFEPLEAPPAFVNALSLCLANSPETRDELLLDGVAPDAVMVMPNSVTDDFFTPASADAGGLSRLAIVSNHVPPELVEAVALLRAEHVHVDLFGTDHQVAHVTPDLVRQYDALVSIGRTVQYGLAMGVPVYCYDHFGGPGWLVPENLDAAAYFNFSGRCCRRVLDASALARDILTGFERARRAREPLQALAKRRYRLVDNTERVLQALAARPDVGHLTSSPVVRNALRHHAYYMRELARSTVAHPDRLGGVHDELKALRQSTSWRITRPLRALATGLRKLYRGLTALRPMGRKTE